MKTWWESKGEVVLCVVVLASAVSAGAQTIISNEALQTTTFIVSKTPVTETCSEIGCFVRADVVGPVTIHCPVDIGKTCTFHINLSAQTNVSTGDLGYYQFLVDGIAPSPSQTDSFGYYPFLNHVSSIGAPPPYYTAQNVSIGLIASVTNTDSQDHTLLLGFACRDTPHSYQPGICRISSNLVEVRLDTFLP
ncbi:MAG: hypothetical protein H0X25_21690 [Acidobacteriales bacterium]|nr:hypothetical protein [Terriglobales bacterium]